MSHVRPNIFDIHLLCPVISTFHLVSAHRTVACSTYTNSINHFLLSNKAPDFTLAHSTSTLPNPISSRSSNPSANWNLLICTATL